MLAGAGAARTSASFAGKTAAATWLLDHGADVNARNHAGLTPLGFARKRNQAEVAALLESKGGKE